MTISEFLLARIAEDEADAGRFDGNRSHPPFVLDHMERQTDDPAALMEIRRLRRLSTWRSRVLAECEAKRQIVERCSAVDYAMPSTHLAHGVLGLLALPYAEHPDYRDEWLP